MVTAIVVGAGPAGRALTHRLTHHGVSVTLIDSRTHRRWIQTYAAWTDELPLWLDRSVIAAGTDAVAVHTTGRRMIDRGYSVFDTTGLQHALSLDEVHVVESRAQPVNPHSVVTDDGTTYHADTVIDCRGAGAGGLSIRGLPHQTAFGIVVPRAAAAPVLCGAEAVLMDWRPPVAHQSWRPDGPVPSFLYAVPLDDDTVLLEETCLVGQPAIPVGDLATRLSTRLASHGLADVANRRRERVSFPVLGASRTPWRSEPIRYGAAGGFLHPTTGYGVATALRWADTAARAVVRGEDLAEALWPWPARQVWRLRLRGLSVLLGLDPAQTIEFFDCFLSLPVAAQRSFLSERADLPGTVSAMRRVFTALEGRTRSSLLREVMRPSFG